jgi:hypothetical protein
VREKKKNRCIPFFLLRVSPTKTKPGQRSATVQAGRLAIKWKYEDWKEGGLSPCPLSRTSIFGVPPEYISCECTVISVLINERNYASR